MEKTMGKAESILSGLGYGDMTVPVHSFNDDDWYVVNTLTREIKASFSASRRDQAEKAAINGLKAVLGMAAKYMGLWRLPRGAVTC